MTLRTDLEHLLNSHSRENTSGTPDFILASHMLAALDNFEATIKARDAWWGFEPKIGGIIPAVGQDAAWDEGVQDDPAVNA